MSVVVEDSITKLRSGQEISGKIATVFAAYLEGKVSGYYTARGDAVLCAGSAGSPEGRVDECLAIRLKDAQHILLQSATPIQLNTISDADRGKYKERALAKLKIAGLTAADQQILGIEIPD